MAMDTKHLYKQHGSDNWRIRATVNGTTINESTGTSILRDAQIIRDDKLAEARKGNHVPAAHMVTIQEIMKAKLIRDKAEGLHSYNTVIIRWNKHLKPFFFGMKAVNVTGDTIQEYKIKRQEEGAAEASINRELALLRTAYRQAVDDRKLPYSAIPPFKLKAEKNARQAYLSTEDYPKMLKSCRKEGIWLAGILVLAYHYGWRVGSLQSLDVGDVNFSTGIITLRGETTKNGEYVSAKMTKEVSEIIGECAKYKRQDHPLFERDGVRIVSYTKAWNRARKKAHVKASWLLGRCPKGEDPELHVHDLCRSGIRNMSQLGISETVIMKVAGRKTRSVFDRYRIVGDDDLQAVADAYEKIEEVKVKEQPKVKVESKPEPKVKKVEPESKPELEPEEVKSEVIGYTNSHNEICFIKINNKIFSVNGEGAFNEWLKLPSALEGNEVTSGAALSKIVKQFEKWWAIPATSSNYPRAISVYLSRAAGACIETEDGKTFRCYQDHYRTNEMYFEEHKLNPQMRKSSRLSMKYDSELINKILGYFNNWNSNGRPVYNRISGMSGAGQTEKDSSSGQ